MILYEDEYLIGVNKPNNILVHHSKMANNQIGNHSLISLLRDKYTKKFYPLHRLDRKTSGIVLFAKEKEFTSKFQDLFLNNLINKTYFGLVRGFTPITLEIDSDVKGRDSLVYKSAFTHLKRIATIELDIPVTPYPTSRYSLVELKPKTGRLHQLRIHMNKISHPLIGDPKYGDRFHNRMFESKFNCNTLFLHAREIEFFHPFYSKKTTIKADFPKNWHKIFNTFNWNSYI